MVRNNKEAPFLAGLENGLRNADEVGIKPADVDDRKIHFLGRLKSGEEYRKTVSA